MTVAVNTYSWWEIRRNDGERMPLSTRHWAKAYPSWGLVALIHLNAKQLFVSTWTGFKWIYIHLLLCALKVEEVHEKVGRTGSSHIYSKLNVSVICVFNLFVYYCSSKEMRHLLSLIQKYPHHPPRETARKIMVEVMFCSLQLSKYDSSSDTKGHLVEQTVVFSFWRSPDWPMLFSFCIES